MNILGRKNRPFLFILDFEFEKCLVFPLEDVPESIQFLTPLGRKVNNSYISPKEDFSSSFITEPVSFEEYRGAYAAVQKELHFGNTFLLNLTFPSKISMGCSLQDIFLHSSAPYKLLIENECVVFSPECFVQIDGGRISTRPMKGTIRKDIPNAREILLSNIKEAAEHDTTVDLLRNDLSLYASRVHVSKYRYLETIRTNKADLLQMSSEISGILPDNYTSILGDIIMSMLPAGSVTGAPKQETLKIIRAVENEPRGYYTGVFGYYEDGKLDSAVMIRFIEMREGEYYFRSGCGITAMSKVEEEYQELIDKVYLPV